MPRVNYSHLSARGIITPRKSGVTIPYDFSINPYVGCAFGCSYCYVRGMQYGDDAEQKSRTWGDWVMIKENALGLLQHSRRRLFGKRIFFGTATDPYQPIEAKQGITRSLLEHLVMAYPSRVHIQTRSPLVVRDLDVFSRFGDTLSVGVSIPTDDDRVRRVFEPSAPSIAQRIAAMETLHHAGIRTTASIAPLLPCRPYEFGALLRGRARGYWMDLMNHHGSDPVMRARYLDNGWSEWIRPDRDAVRRQIEAGWLGDPALPEGHGPGHT